MIDVSVKKLHSFYVSPENFVGLSLVSYEIQYKKHENWLSAVPKMGSLNVETKKDVILLI